MLRQESQRTLDLLKLNLLDEIWLDEETGMPTVERCDVVPSRIVGFNHIRTMRTCNFGVHFYIEDYQFERVWNRPHNYVSNLCKYECIVSPDFSVYIDMPFAMILWQIYRNRLLSQWWQRSGIDVVYNIQLAGVVFWSFVFNGIKKGGVYAIRTPLDFKRNAQGRRLFFMLLDEIMIKLMPQKILVYSSGNITLPTDMPIVQFDNDNIKRIRTNDNGR